MAKRPRLFFDITAEDKSGQAFSSLQKHVSDSEQRLSAMGRQFAVVAGAASAFGAALVGAAMKGAQQIDEVAKSARRLDSSIGGFRALRLAAGEAGVSLSGLTNDVQTMNRELSANSAGAQRALHRLRLSAADLARVDADEKMAIISDRVREMGLSAGEATGLLRDLGVRNREMALLMLQGGDAIRRARKDVEDYGLALSNVEASRIEQANDAISRLGLISEYAGQRIAQNVVPAFGRFAQAMTESLRAGGLLRTAIDGFADNIQRITTYVGVAVTAFGVRYVAALAAARIATLTLAGSLAFLRGALIRTGIGALIVGAGELIYQFSRLVQAAGGFGNAMSLLGNVAWEVLDRIKTAIGLIPDAFLVAGQGAANAFIGSMEWMTRETIAQINGMLTTINGIVRNAGFADQLFGLLPSPASIKFGRLEIGGTEAAERLSSALQAPLKSMEALRGVMASVTDETGAAADAADRFGSAFDSVNSAMGTVGNAGRAAFASIRNEMELAKPLADDFSQMMQTAFSGISSAIAGAINGTQKFGDALRNVMSQLAQMAINRVFTPVMGGHFTRTIFARAAA